jgi:hypothetical protein
MVQWWCKDNSEQRIFQNLYFTKPRTETKPLIYIKKAVPLQDWSGPEGSRKLRFPDLLTTAQDGGKVVSLSRPVTGLEWPREFQKVKVRRFIDNGTGWW